MSSNALSPQHVVAYAFFCKTGNPKNDDFSDKSGSYRVMHESFNNVFDTKNVRNFTSFMVALSASFTPGFMKYCYK